MEINVWGIRMKKKKKGFWKRNIGLAFVMPWLIGLLVFKLYPFAASFIYSFHSYNLFKTASFTALKSARRLLFSKSWLRLSSSPSMVLLYII